MKVTEQNYCTCHNCFRFSHYAIEIKYGTSGCFYLCARCADALKDALNEVRVMGKLTLGETEYVTSECKKCGGSGFSRYEYSYDTVCEECGGTGLRLVEVRE